LNEVLYSTLPYYMEKLKGIFASEIPILNLNLAHVRQFNEHLYKIIISYPDVNFIKNFTKFF